MDCEVRGEARSLAPDPVGVTGGIGRSFMRGSGVFLPCTWPSVKEFEPLLRGLEGTFNDLKILTILADADVPWMGRRDEALAIDPIEKIEEKSVPFGVEFRAHVVEKKDGRVAVELAQELDLCGLPGEDESSQLALRGEGAGLVVAQEEHDVVDVRTDARLTARQIAAAIGLEGR